MGTNQTTSMHNFDSKTNMPVTGNTITKTFKKISVSTKEMNKNLDLSKVTVPVTPLKQTGKQIDELTRKAREATKITKMEKIGISTEGVERSSKEMTGLIKRQDLAEKKVRKTFSHQPTKQISNMQKLDKETVKFNNNIMGTQWKKFQQGVPILQGISAHTDKGAFSVSRLNKSIRAAPIDKQQQMWYHVQRFNRNIKAASSGQRQFNMDLLSGMFFFMSLSMALNSFLRPSREAVGVFQIWGDYMTIIFLPAAMQALKFVMWIGEGLLWLTDTPHIPIVSDLLNLAGISDEKVGSFFSSVLNWGLLIVATLVTIGSMVYMTLLGAGGLSFAITSLNKVRLGRMIVSTLTGALDIAIISAQSLKGALVLVKNISLALLHGNLTKAWKLIRSNVVWTLLFGKANKIAAISSIANISKLRNAWVMLRLSMGVTFLTGITGATTLAGALAIVGGCMVSLIAGGTILASSLTNNVWGVKEQFLKLYILVGKVTGGILEAIVWAQELAGTTGTQKGIEMQTALNNALGNTAKLEQDLIDLQKESRGTMTETLDEVAKIFKLDDLTKAIGIYDIMGVNTPKQPKIVGPKIDWGGTGPLYNYPTGKEKYPKDQYSTIPGVGGTGTIAGLTIPEVTIEDFKMPEVNVTKFNITSYENMVSGLQELAGNIEGKSDSEMTTIINNFEITNNNDISSDVDMEKIMNGVDEIMESKLGTEVRN